MARPKTLRPKYCHNKADGRAFITLNGKRKYLGPPGSYGSTASRDEYDRLVGEWIAAGRAAPVKKSNNIAGVTISTVIAAFWTHGQTYYNSCVRSDGKAIGELDNYRLALKPLRRLYGSTPAARFGPLALEGLQQEAIKQGWSRTYINRQINRVRHVFKWAALKEMIPASVHHGLVTVPGLRVGRSEAEESEPVKPVPDRMLAQTLPFLSRHVRAMVDLQLLTGARPGEIVTMRTCDINRTGKVWVHEPVQHKTQHHGHSREIRIGPKAQKVLDPFLRTNLAAHIFSPAEAEAERRAKLHERRLKNGTPLNQGNRPGEIHRRFLDHYTVTTYRRAIARACEAAFQMSSELREPTTKDAIKAELALPADVQAKRKKERRDQRAEWREAHTWHPHQLRHNSATLLRPQYGIEAARLILGHRSAAVTEIYAEMDASKAEAIMAEVG